MNKTSHASQLATLHLDPSQPNATSSNCARPSSTKLFQSKAGPALDNLHPSMMHVKTPSFAHLMRQA